MRRENEHITNNKIVSVIVPVYQAEKYIERCVNSLIHQTYHNLEIILIDDGSKDKSLELVQKIKDPRVSVYSDGKNLKLAARLNQIVDLAKYDYIARMDADDLMMMALDAGAEDFNEEEDSFEVLTTPDDFSAVREALEKEEIPMADASVTMIPGTMVELTSEEDIKNIQKTLDLLDEDDDVQEVYTNWDE